MQKCEIFSKIFEEIQGGSISQSERTSKKITASQFTYGEIELVHFIALLKTATTKPGGIFWDLGCGAGKALIAAALSYNKFSKVCGVELLDGLYEAAEKSVQNYTKTMNDKGMKVDPGMFKVVKDDMLTIDWADADVIYTSSICFPDELIKGLTEKGKALNNEF